jgi:sugar phosphate isomerase/epimerase
VAQAEALGIVFGIEAHIASIVPDPRSAERLVSSVPGLSLTLDYTHFTRLGIPDREVDPLLPYASHFHVRGARQGRLQVNFDQNTIDYARIVEGLRSYDYQGWLGVEYVWIDWEQCNESDNVSESIRFRDFLRFLAGQA